MSSDIYLLPLYEILWLSGYGKNGFNMVASSGEKAFLSRRRDFRMRDRYVPALTCSYSRAAPPDDCGAQALSVNVGNMYIDHFCARLSLTIIVINRSYVAKTTEQLEHALSCMDAAGVELHAAEVVGEGGAGKAAFEREVNRVRAQVQYARRHR